MVQIHDEKRSIQMTILHIYKQTNKQTNKQKQKTAQTRAVITNNGNKNSKYRPESDTVSEKRQQQCEPFK